MDVSEEREIVLRLVNLLANMACTANARSLKPEDLPVEDKAAAPDTMYAAVFGVTNIDKVLEKAKTLMNMFDDEDVRIQSRKLFNALKVHCNSKDNQETAEPSAATTT